MQEPNYKNTARKQLYKKKLRIKYITLFLVLLAARVTRPKFIKRSITERLAL